MSCFFIGTVYEISVQITAGHLQQGGVRVATEY